MNHKVARVLVIDDEPTIRMFTANALRNEGLECECAPDAPSARSTVRDKPYDVAIVDLRLPGQNGHSFALELMQEEQRPLVVILTAVCEPRLVKDLYARGVADVVFKPVNYSAFATKIKVIIERFNSKSLESMYDLSERARNEQLMLEVAAIEAQLQKPGSSELDVLRWLSVIDPHRLPEPTWEQQSMARCLSAELPYTDKERRTSAHLPYIFSVVAAEINWNGQVVGRPFKMVARDLSLAGIGFIHERKVASKFLGIAWESTKGEAMTAIVEVLRCQASGKSFDIGARFLTDASAIAAET